jgi:hypothetical protein
LVLAVMFVGVGVGMFRVGVWPALIATSDGLVIRNPVRRHVVAWEDIERLEPGYYGIVIFRRHGRPVIAVAVQKSNVASATGVIARADRVIAKLEAIAAQSGTTGDRQLAPSVERRGVLASSARRLIATGTGGIVVWTVIRIVLA